MKWSVAGLVVLGIVAALSAAMLMSLFTGRNGLGTHTAPDSDASVLVAAHDLPANAMIDANAVELRKVPRSTVPEQAVSTSVEAVGKILKTSMTAGQVFNRDMFVTEGNAQLAGSLPIGKRAFALSLTDFAGLDGVLYPGSVVDVLLTVAPAGSSTAPVSRTVLEAVQVLAIERQTVVAKDAEKKTDTEDRHGRNARRVTLLVSSEQAAKLNLAMNQGTLALALRNPLDKEAAYNAPVSMAALMPNSEPAAPVDLAKSPAAEPTGPVTTGNLFGSGDKTASSSKPGWETTVIRGSTVQTVNFPSETAPVDVASEKDH